MTRAEITQRIYAALDALDAHEQARKDWLAEWKSRMPRWASRLSLLVTDVRCQRVQEISEEDAVAEGCSGHDGEGPYISAFGGRRIINNFAALWDTLNAKRGYSWDANPWVWAYTFRVPEVRR